MSTEIKNGGGGEVMGLIQIVNNGSKLRKKWRFPCPIFFYCNSPYRNLAFRIAGGRCAQTLSVSSTSGLGTV